MDFPIVGWYFLPEGLARPEVFANIRRCGINVFMTCRGVELAVRRQLDLAADEGLQAIVCDERLRLDDNPDWREQTRRAVAAYAEHPAAFGFYVRDEPVRAQFEQVAERVEALRGLAPDKPAYVNAFGFGGRGSDSFEQYVEDYARIIRPPFLSFDCYPISRLPAESARDICYADDCGLEYPEIGAYIRGCYWEAWETFLRAGWRHGLPLWGFALSTPHEHSVWFYGPVNEGTVRLQVFTAMAYGAQAVQYFALPCVTGMAWDDGILDPAGTPSVRYDVFRRVNRDVAALGPRVRPFTCVGVYHTGPLTSGCRRFAAVRPGRDPSHLPLMRVEGDPVLLSFFQDARGGRGLMVVNRNAGRAARVRLELAGGWRANEIGRVDGLPLRDLGSAFAVNLEPGDGRFFCLTRPATGAP